MQKRYSFIVSLLASACLTSTYAAEAIDVSHQSVTMLKPFLSKTTSSLSSLKLLSQDTDFNQTTHTKLQQTYQGYPVWGGEVIVHTPKGLNTSFSSLANEKATMNGTIYEKLADDISMPPVVDTQNAIKQAQAIYQNKTGIKASITEPQAELMVYIDDQNKAHWAYLVNFIVKKSKGMIEKPTYVLDANTFKIYEEWDDIQTLEKVSGGGFGGNPKLGKLMYDGLRRHLPTLTMSRDVSNKTCFLQNDDVTVKDVRKNDAISEFACASVDKNHNNIYWSADLGAINDAYSPDNDALYIGKIVKEMYQKWYDIPVLADTNGNPMMLNMRVHEDMENAYWDGKQMTFGDGGDYFYPLVSLGVGAHEVSHGFTQQHSNLFYAFQPGGMNESFSDMAAQAAEYYSTGTNSWQIGPEIVKDSGALRYMDEPTKDCNGRAPGDKCSISNAKDFTRGLNVHYSSGVFNKAFYLIATSPDWNTKKAFDIMVKANQHYWTKYSTFNRAACGVVSAAKDYNYSVNDVKKAFQEVGVDASNC